MKIFNRFRKWVSSIFWTQQRELSIVGIENAGKTTFVNTLSKGVFDSDTVGTIGFNRRQVKKGGVQLNIWDLAGGERFRKAWGKYCKNVDCIIFIVDSADLKNIQLSHTELHNLMANPSLSGIPLLVLGNKNDLNGSLNEEELISILELRSISNRSVSCYSVSAKSQNNIEAVLSYLSKLPAKNP